MLIKDGESFAWLHVLMECVVLIISSNSHIKKSLRTTGAK